MGRKKETKLVNDLSQMLIVRYLTDHECDPRIVKQVEETFGITDKISRENLTFLTLEDIIRYFIPKANTKTTKQTTPKSSKKIENVDLQKPIKRRSSYNVECDDEDDFRPPKIKKDKSLVAQFKNDHGTSTEMGSGSSGIDKEMKKENKRQSFRLSKLKLSKPDPLQNEICLNVKDDRELGLSIKILKEKGRAVFTQREFARGDPVVEYVGDLMDSDQAKAREDGMYASDDEGGGFFFYFNWKGRKYCLDASDENCHRYGRLINHSRLRPNLRPRVLEVLGKPRLVFFATRDIKEVSQDTLQS